MLRGEKVVLRATERTDLPRMWEFHNDPALHLLIADDPWEPQSLARLETRFDEKLHEAEHDGPWFAVEADGLYIGHCGLHSFDDLSRTCQIGIGIGDKTYRGRGYGREAIRLVLDYAFRLRNMHKVWLTVNGDNEQAIRAYGACGFVEEGRLRRHVWVDGAYIDLVQMGLLREEWEKMQAAYSS